MPRVGEVPVDERNEPVQPKLDLRARGDVGRSEVRQFFVVVRICIGVSGRTEET